MYNGNTKSQGIIAAPTDLFPDTTVKTIKKSKVFSAFFVFC